jgi:GTPase
VTEFRAGIVSVVGRPNAGKSTLINALLGQKVAAVSPRPQTTRRRQLGILSRPEGQLVFVDTPGVHSPHHKLGEYLDQEVRASLEGIDAVLCLVDLSEEPDEDDKTLAARIASVPPSLPMILAGNKVDLLALGAGDPRLEQYRDLFQRDCESLCISAVRGDGLEELVASLLRMCPPRPALYDPDQVTDLYEREIAADLIREAALKYLRDEVPHGIAVSVDEFKERPQGLAYIASTIFVDRDSQKAIVIGEGGKMLKQIGTQARHEIEAMGGRRVFLELRVKVEKGWRNNPAFLSRLGYKLKR